MRHQLQPAPRRRAKLAELIPCGQASCSGDTLVDVPLKPLPAGDTRSNVWTGSEDELGPVPREAAAVNTSPLADSGFTARRVFRHVAQSPDLLTPEVGSSSFTSTAKETSLALLLLASREAEHQAAAVQRQRRRRRSRETFC